jgi:hypothetical protein
MTSVRWSTSLPGPTNPALFGEVVVAGVFPSLAGFDRATGAELWRRAVDLLATPRASGDLLYLATLERPGGRRKAVLLALDLATGEIRWRAVLPNEPLESGLAVDHRRVVVLATRGRNRPRLLEFDPRDGRIVRETVAPIEFASCATLRRGRLFLATEGADRGLAKWPRSQARPGPVLLPFEFGPLASDARRLYASVVIEDRRGDRALRDLEAKTGQTIPRVPGGTGAIATVRPSTGEVVDLRPARVGSPVAADDRGLAWIEGDEEASTLCLEPRGGRTMRVGEPFRECDVFRIQLGERFAVVSISGYPDYEAVVVSRADATIVARIPHEGLSLCGEFGVALGEDLVVVSRKDGLVAYDLPRSAG